MRLLRHRDHGRKALTNAERAARDESPRPREVGAAKFSRGLARIGRARASKSPTQKIDAYVCCFLQGLRMRAGVQSLHFCIFVFSVFALSSAAK